MSHPDHVLGIDLGTSTSCVAAVVDGRPVVLANSQGQEIISSIVAYRPGGEVLVGEAARPYLVTESTSTIYSFKRIMGRRWDDPGLRSARESLPYSIVEEGGGVAIEVGHRRMSVPDVAARVLGELVAAAEASLGAPTRRAVIAVPTMWNDAQRESVRIAGKIAGLEVLGVINEPTAAALAFGYERSHAQILAVYDFGGGTFDFTILEIEGPVVRVVGAAGDAFLGGDDLDRALAFAAAEAFHIETGRHLWRDEAEWQRLLFASEQAKRTLSEERSAVIRVPKAAHTSSGPKDLSFKVDRKRFRSICSDKIKQTFSLAGRALAEAGLTTAELDGVMLVGGTTYVRMVRAGVANFFGKPPTVGVDPLRAVAVGAAVQGAALAGVPMTKLSDRTLLEVTPHALGVVVSGTFHPVIDRGEPLPAEEARSYTTTEDDQAQLVLALYHGDPAIMDKGCYLGDVVFDALPPGPAGKVVVDVTFRLSVENKVSLTAVERRTGRKVKCILNDLVCREDDDEPRDTRPDQGSVDDVLKNFLDD